MTTPRIRADLALDAHARLGEGPVWDQRHAQLVWVDIQGQAVHLSDPSTGADRSLPVGSLVGAVVVRAGGGFVVAVQKGFSTLDPVTGRVETLVEVDADDDTTRMNDGKVDPAGRFWAGTMGMGTNRPVGSLYRLDPDGTVTTMLRDVAISNGLGWSPDRRTMYYIDTPTRRVDALDYDLAAGTIANRRPLFEIPAEAGSPDGMTVDADGCLWVCLWSGGAVRRYTPDGRLDRIVEVPAKFTTSCAFGGPAYEELYITSASDPVPEGERSAQPHAGGVFVCRPGVKGVPSFDYAG